MRKPESVSASGPSAGGVSDADWGKRFPTICEYLTADAFDDGTPRELSSLSIRMEGGEVRLALNDPYSSRSMYTAARSVKEALELMEGHLKSSGGSWRPWKAGARGKRG